MVANSLNHAARKHRARTVTAFRPIAMVRLLKEVLAYMLLARIKPVLEACQPEGQHGFRPQCRLEERLVYKRGG